MSAARSPQPEQRPRFAVPGQLIILTVALLWGTNPPALRYLYASDGPPSPAALAGVQATAAVTLLLLLSAARSRLQGAGSGGAAREQRGDSSSSLAGGGRPRGRPAEQQEPSRRWRREPADLADADADPEAAEPERRNPQVQRLIDLEPAGSGGSPSVRRRHSLSIERSMDLDDNNSSRGVSLKDALNSSTDRLLLAGAEVGAWGFLANAATVSGFQNTAASRGAFLIRLSAIMTPLIASLAGEAISLRIWAGCIAALAGGVLMTLSHSGSDAAGAFSGLAAGDGLLIGAALLWSIQTVRLGRHAAKFEPLAMAAASMTAMAVLSDVWLAADVSSAVISGKPADSVWAGCRVPLNWAVMLWPAFAPWGAGQALQVAGQSMISSSQTQILMASDPLWATLFAGVLGSAEQDLGPAGWAGGALIIAGAVLAGTGGSAPHGQRPPDELE
jgi:drug/metabolite transporter (DMT)-like permease